MLSFIQKFVGLLLNTLGWVFPKLTGKLGFDLFCLPFAKKLKPHQKTYLLKSKWEVILYENDRIQCYRWGKGSKKILLVHGWASHSYRWKSLIEHHKNEDYSFYAFDAPAHGLSEGRFLNLLILSDLIYTIIKQIGPIHGLIGHSIGGYGSLYCLHQNPNLGELRTVILAAPGEVTDFFEYYKKMLGLSNRTNQLLNQAFYLRTGKNPYEFSSSLLAQSIQNKALIIHDKKDRDTDFQYSVRLHDAWKNSELILTEGLGHSLKSKELESVILDFLK